MKINLAVAALGLLLAFPAFALGTLTPHEGMKGDLPVQAARDFDYG